MRLAHKSILAPLMTVVALTALAAPAWAHPKLVSSAPAEGASAAKVSQVTLTFSEPLVAALSGVDLVMTAMPGMEHHAAMKMNGVRVTLGADGKSLVASLPRPLPAGAYEADWHAVSTDTHRVAGKLTFEVK